MSSQKIVIFYFITALFLSCRKGKVVIESNSDLNVTATDTFHGRPITHKVMYFKVYNCNYDNETWKTIEDYVKKYVQKDALNYNDYSAAFNEAVDTEGAIDFKNHPDRYYNLENEVCDFRWSDGKLIGFTKMKDGKILNPDPGLKVEILPANK